MNKFISKHRKSFVVIISSIIWTLFDVTLYYARSGDSVIALLGMIPLLIEKIILLIFVFIFYDLLGEKKK